LYLRRIYISKPYTIIKENEKSLCTWKSARGTAGYAILSNDLVRKEMIAYKSRGKRHLGRVMNRWRETIAADRAYNLKL
jgi:hypothetical protein